MNPTLYGIVPGAADWVENFLYCTHYREVGAWCAHLSPARDGWDMNVWLYRYGPGDQASRVAHEHVTGTLDRAKGLADAILASRTAGHPAPGEDPS